MLDVLMSSMLIVLGVTARVVWWGESGGFEGDVDGEYVDIEGVVLVQHYLNIMGDSTLHCSWLTRMKCNT